MEWLYEVIKKIIVKLIERVKIVVAISLLIEICRPNVSYILLLIFSNKLILSCYVSDMGRIGWQGGLPISYCHGMLPSARG